MKSLKEYSMNIPESEYHALPVWSYSLIARYAKEGFGSLATLHEPVVSTPSMDFGSLFDCVMTKGNSALNEYFVMDSTIPDAERKALDYISTCTSDAFADLTTEFIYDRCQECGYQTRWKAPTVYEHLSPYKAYYEAKRSGKKIVSQKDWTDAADMAFVFRNDPYLSKLFGLRDTKDIEYIYQSQFLVKYRPENHEPVGIKIMPDLLVVNHKDKTVQPVDLKTSSAPAYDFKENFVKYRYDIQASLYTDVLAQVLKTAEGYEDYTILPYLFTDVSRSDKVPVTYVYNPKAESQINGLCFGNGERQYQYKGWRDLLGEILNYEDAQAKVPNYIKLGEPNDLLDILCR